MVHALTKLLGTLAVLGMEELIMLTAPVLDGGGSQHLIDPALGPQGNIHMVLPHQVIDDGIAAGAVPALVERNGFVFQNAALPDNLDGR